MSQRLLSMIVHLPREKLLTLSKSRRRRQIGNPLYFLHGTIQRDLRIVLIFTKPFLGVVYRLLSFLFLDKNISI